ncbi:hypothetical protein ABS71_14175 [bacterium SCN 62-11]|nr:hypothetical protein [Candidatus Eremiobacteraeota bacterium]ODT63542.1 MAG: hypothetical protein ABS71_14175 [bacterium SCN 62-11]
MRGRVRGLTLLESVFASFLLLWAILIVVRLFHSGIGYTSRSLDQETAVLLAEQHLERMRLWSETVSGGVYNYDQLTSLAVYNGTPIAGDLPGFTLTTRVMARELYSGCSQIELSRPADRRVLTDSACTVQVDVKWAGDSRKLRLCTLLARPALTFPIPAASPTLPTGVTISPPADNPVPHLGSTTLQAGALDRNGSPIRDLFYDWELVPISGAATLEQSRSGASARLYNWVYLPDGSRASTGGDVTIRVTARYHGQTVFEETAPIHLL